MLQACEGLAEAHAARIVHRDLKPGNLFRAQRPDGSDIIKVLDFGVSKALSQDVRAEGTVTTTDAVFGSPLYMSPEQMQSASKADERSDIWSLGVVLYELVTGKMPFDAESMAGLAVRIATDPPSRMIEALPTTPPALEAVVFKCLEKKPDNRYPNIAELAADLEPFAPGSRSRVERIQRLVFGMTNPPRPVPSAPSLRRVALGAETLGPLDTGGSLPRIPIPKKRPMVPIALGVGLAVGLGLAAAMFVHNGNHAVQADAPVPSASPPPVASTTVAATQAPPAQAHAATAETATAEPAETASAAHATRPHHHTVPSVHTAATAAPTAVMMGISRDRK